MYANTTVSPDLSLTLCGKDVCFPGFTSSATASRYCSAPWSRQTLPDLRAIARYAESFFLGTGTTTASMYMVASLGGVQCSCCSGKRRERERDRHCAEADRGRVDVHPRVLAEG